jgi:hypothetical protein
MTPHLVFAFSGQEWPRSYLYSLATFQLTFRVAEPEGLARRLPLLANGVTDQGFGRSERSERSRQRGVM